MPRRGGEFVYASGSSESPTEMALTIHSKFGKWRHSGSAKLGPVHAQVNHGRWIVECPCCPSAAVAQGDRFLCAECGNSAAGGRYFEVAWPSRERAKRISQLLAVRPVENRNWLPGEDLDILRFENIEHGLAA